VIPTLKDENDIFAHAQSYLKKELPVINLLPTISAPLVARVTKYAITDMGAHFIAGSFEDSSSLSKTKKNLEQVTKRGLTLTLDVLGEYSLSESIARNYVEIYKEVITNFAYLSPSISVKLTALYSQLSVLNFSKSVEILCDRLEEIVLCAKAHGLSVFIDAEDQASNVIIYEVVKELFKKPHLRDVFFGVVIQAYSKDGAGILEELVNHFTPLGIRFGVRLVKGAYWDQERATAIDNGWPMPLFSQKSESDKEYNLLTNYLLSKVPDVYPCFASHNLVSLMDAINLARKMKIDPSLFEVQTLYGMGDKVATIMQAHTKTVRVYTPLGELIPGMGYLVRRLLENTSNEFLLKKRC
jgi:RHH-type proline utilization regulon transcriptional repressor/proline dehydrogenase/delta 1-pyrroline-5-carboxylate dehydrogenase